MGEEKSNMTNGGVGFVGLLQLVFIVLKLCGVIAWSWWLVMLPLIIEASFVVVVLFVSLIVIFYENDKKQEEKVTKDSEKFKFDTK